MYLFAHFLGIDGVDAADWSIASFVDAGSWCLLEQVLVETLAGEMDNPGYPICMEQTIWQPPSCNLLFLSIEKKNTRKILFINGVHLYHFEN